MIHETKTVVRREARIDNVEEAYNILETFRRNSTRIFNETFGSTNTSEACVLAYAAAAKLLGVFAESVEPEAFAALGVKCRPSDAPEPTWTSTDGRTQRVCDMPTRYLVNILRRYGNMGGAGIYAAIRNELDKRPDIDA